MIPAPAFPSPLIYFALRALAGLLLLAGAFGTGLLFVWAIVQAPGGP